MYDGGIIGNMIVLMDVSEIIFIIFTNVWRWNYNYVY